VPGKQAKWICNSIPASPHPPFGHLLLPSTMVRQWFDEKLTNLTHQPAQAPQGEGPSNRRLEFNEIYPAKRSSRLSGICNSALNTIAIVIQLCRSKRQSPGQFDLLFSQYYCSTL